MWPEMSSTYGGDIATRPIPGGNSHDHRPEQAMYRVELDLEMAIDSNLHQRELGVVHLEAQPESFAKRWYEHVVAVLMRESGF